MPKHSTAPLATTTLLHDALNNHPYWLRWWEMMVASGLTIGLRLSGISYRLQKNRLPDMQELWRMTEEKHTAAQQSLAALPMAASAHKAWLQPSQTVLAGNNPWITVDAAVSNDLFYFNHVPLRLDNVAVIAPDGSEVRVTLPRWGRTLGVMIKVRDEVSGGIDERGRVSKGLTPGEGQRLARAELVARRILIEAGCRDDSIVRTPLRGTHPSATARIGDVVDTELQTSVRGLYVCDASVFPEALGRPTVLTILALARRLARPGGPRTRRGRRRTAPPGRAASAGGSPCSCRRCRGRRPRPIPWRASGRSGISPSGGTSRRRTPRTARRPAGPRWRPPRTAPSPP